MSDTLFGKKIISTINYDEQEIIRDILYLHCDNKDIDLDPTYSIGQFYTKGLRQPKYKFDKYPINETVKQATSDNLPLEDNSINVIMFDPPFIMGTTKNYPIGSGQIGTRFTAFKNFKESNIHKVTISNDILLL